MLESKLTTLPPEADSILDAAMDGDLSDGLPIVPPTEQAIGRMLKFSPYPKDHVVGVMAPLMVEATLERIAICAVAAGCKPAYFPVVVAAVEAMLEPEFNLLAIQTTTELASPLLIVNGPIAERIHIQSTSGCLGPGFRANATIGRAVRLVAMCIGGAVPGETDMATFGHGGKFSACMAEAESLSPWEPFHVERGYAKDISAVTVVGADAPVNVNDFVSSSAESVARMIGETMSYPGSNNAQGGGEVLVVMSSVHAEVFQESGLGKRDVKKALFQKARISMDRFSVEIADRIRDKRKHVYGEKMPDSVPVVDDPKDILIAVAGGPGSHTLFFPTYGVTKAVTKVISEPAKGGSHETMS